MPVLQNSLEYGSVHAELVSEIKKKDAADQIKMAALQDSIKEDATINPVEDMLKMDLPEETIKKVEQALENEAKSKVAEIQGQYYETYD